MLTALFSQLPKRSRAFLYDAEATNQEHKTLNNVVVERLASIFQLHGAFDDEPPLLFPAMNPEEEKNHAMFIDTHGDIVILPSNILLPFARLAGRSGYRRIKRYHICNVFKSQWVL